MPLRQGCSQSRSLYGSFPWAFIWSSKALSPRPSPPFTTDPSQRTTVPWQLSGRGSASTWRSLEPGVGRAPIRPNWRANFRRHSTKEVGMMSTENTTIVETHGLTKRFGSGFLAVDGVDMSVRRGEVYGFLGPNGAGKTTTLKMLVGLIRATSGTATVAGHAPGDPVGLAKIGCLIEGPGFYPYLSGRENLRVVADLASVSQRRVDEVLDLIEMTSRAGRKFGTYSTGMKMRIGVAAALLKDPELLILDEPTAGLDPQGMAEMRKLITDIGQGERTVLLSSHLLGEAEQICDRVGVISNGRLANQTGRQDLLGEKGVVVRAEPSEKASEVLTRMFGAASVVHEDGYFHLKTDPARSMDINRDLINAGIGVSELSPFERALEEVFFQLTGEKQGS